MEKGRLEAFSDGVFAVAITLLVFDLAVPHVSQGHLAGALGHEWPQAAAYVVSFMVIGIIWVNHHAVLGMVKQADRVILAVNLALLLPVVSIPFATELFATYLAGGGDNARLAAATYSGVMTVMAVAFTGLYLAILREARLVHDHIDLRKARRNAVRFGSGQVVYLGTVGLSFLSPVATLATHFALAGFYLLDQVRPRAPETAIEEGEDPPVDP